MKWVNSSVEWSKSVGVDKVFTRLSDFGQLIRLPFTRVAITSVRVLRCTGSLVSGSWQPTTLGIFYLSFYEVSHSVTSIQFSTSSTKQARIAGTGRSVVSSSAISTDLSMTAQINNASAFSYSPQVDQSIISHWPCNATSWSLGSVCRDRD